MRNGLPFWYIALRQAQQFDPDPPPPATPPVVKPADPAVAKYTEEQLQGRLRGSGTRIKQLEDEAAARAAKDKEAGDKAKAAKDAKAIENGKAADVAKSKDAELTAANERLAKFEADDKARKEALEKSNAERVKALPKELTQFPLSADPEEAAKQLTALEAQGAVTTTKRGNRVKASPAGLNNETDAQTRVTQKQSGLNDHFMGVKKEAADA